MTIDLTEAAISDLQSIRDYTLETWGEAQEQEYLDSLWTRFEEILADPERWRFRNDLFAGCQSTSQGKHVILFRIDANVLQIVRLLHSAMDFRRHLPGKD